MDALEEAGVRVVHVTPSHHYPLGIIMPVARRQALLRWAEAAPDRYILEDDYDSEFRFSGRPIPALQSLSGGKRVAYLGSFSKLLLPSVRIGYLAMPEELASPYWDKAGGYNQTASKIEQLALARYIREGNLERQLRRLRKLYAAKSGLFYSEIKKIFGGRVKISLWETSLCFRLEPESRLSSKELVHLALKRGVRLTLREGRGHEDILAGFAGIPVESIPGAAASLGEAWDPVLDRKGARD